MLDITPRIILNKTLIIAVDDIETSRIRIPGGFGYSWELV